MKKVLLIGLFIFPGLVSGQDIHFSQYFNNLLHYNPGYAGAMKKLEAVSQYRSQWKTVTAPFNTIAASISGRISDERNRSGILSAGLNFHSDKSANGGLGMLKIEVPVAYQLKVNDNNLIGGGISFGFGQNTYNPGGYTWNSQYDGLQYNAALNGDGDNAISKFNYFDLGSGISWIYSSNNKNMSSNDRITNTFGFSVHHLNRPRFSFFDSENVALSMKYVIYDQLFIGIPNSRIAIIPSFLFQLQAQQQELMFGTMVRYRLQDESHFTGFVKGSALSLGLYHRKGDAFAAQLQLEFDKYAIGFSYDLNTSQLRDASNLKGGFEICLRFITPGAFEGSKSSKLF